MIFFALTALAGLGVLILALTAKAVAPMTINGKNIALGDLAALITATSGTDTAFEARDHSGTVLGSAGTARVTNSDILRSLLADRGIAVM